MRYSCNWLVLITPARQWSADETTGQGHLPPSVKSLTLTAYVLSVQCCVVKAPLSESQPLSQSSLCPCSDNYRETQAKGVKSTSALNTVTCCGFSVTVMILRYIGNPAETID